MEAMATPDTCISHCNFLEENPGSLNPIEIRRFSTMTNGSNFVDVAKKRCRCFRSASSCGNAEPGMVNSETAGGTDSPSEAKKSTKPMPGSSHSQDLNSQRGLVRSVSTPSLAMEGLLRACPENQSLRKGNNRKENSIQEEEGEVDAGHEIKTKASKQAEIEKPTICSFPRVDGVPMHLSRANSENISFMLKDSCPPHGMMAVIGRRSEMEDTVSAVPSFFSLPPNPSSNNNNNGSSSSSNAQQGKNASLSALHFFGVYDGHGGSQASMFCKDRFHEALAEGLRALPPPQNDNSLRDLKEWEKVMTDCFMKMDIEVGGICPSGICVDSDDTTSKNITCRSCQHLIAPENVGSTAVVAVVSPSQIVVANCGDSRAVLSRGGKAIPFSTDHKPERADEMVRIEAAGGRVIYWNGYRVGGFLAMSRAIGDRFLKQYVISEPEVTCTERTDDDECLILASDGLWDVLSNDLVCEVARKCLAGYRPHRSKGISEGSAVNVAAALLTKLALGRGSEDNISVVVIDLKDRSSSKNKNSNSCASLV